MSANRNSNSYGMELRLDHVEKGIEAFWPAGVDHIVIRGVRYTRPELAAHVKEMNKRWKDAREAHAVLRQFTADKPQLVKEAGDFLADLKGILGGHVGRDNEVLTEFGFKPVKRRRSLTVEEKALRAAKARLTRKMRGTKGKRQLAEIRATETPDVTILPDGTMHIVSPAERAATVEPPRNGTSEAPAPPAPGPAPNS